MKAYCVYSECSPFKSLRGPAYICDGDRIELFRTCEEAQRSIERDARDRMAAFDAGYLEDPDEDYCDWVETVDIISHTAFCDLNGRTYNNWFFNEENL